MTNSISDELTIAAAQISPDWLERDRTIEKVRQYVADAARRKCQLVCFPEALVPGYPFWIERTEGARFNDPAQKELYALYQQQAVQIEAGHLQPICSLAREHAIGVVLGCIERPMDRGGHSLFCSAVYIDREGTIRSVHRKLVPTHEERLAWSHGDGQGLVVHPLQRFTMGVLNCWENWMPLPRAALYGQGEDFHVALWPGGEYLTRDITRFIALESRSYVLSASGVFRRDDIDPNLPHAAVISRHSKPFLANGGSCLAAPDGKWIIEPVIEQECLLTATIDHALVRQERLNIDPAGHYCRPDVTRLIVDRTRQQTVHFENNGSHSDQHPREAYLDKTN